MQNAVMKWRRALTFTFLSALQRLRLGRPDAAVLLRLHSRQRNRRNNSLHRRDARPKCSAGETQPGSLHEHLRIEAVANRDRHCIQVRKQSARVRKIFKERIGSRVCTTTFLTFAWSAAQSERGFRFFGAPRLRLGRPTNGFDLRLRLRYRLFRALAFLERNPGESLRIHFEEPLR